jgi:hypothetical protein
MSSEVEICNMALSHLGDSATVASIDPPEGSAQAEHCARWYPIARDALLELHTWTFATRRMLLAEVANPYTQWQYAYARPSDCLKMIAVLASDATDDYSMRLANSESAGVMRANQLGAYTPQPFAIESDDSGSQIIVTNQADALARYTRYVTDTARFSPLFRNTLARYLASYLAGPVLKGSEGINVGTAQMQIAMNMLAGAAVSDANQQRQDVVQQFPWER